MRTRLSHIIIFMLAILATASCHLDKFDDNPVVKGRPVTAIKMTVSMPAPTEIVTTKAMTDETETNIETLAIFFFAESNTSHAANRIYVSGTDFDLGDPYAVTSTNYTYDIELDPDSESSESIITSGNWYVYAIANWNKGMFMQDIDELESMTRTQLDNFCIVKTSTAINPSETALLLTGRYGSDNTGLVTLQEGDNDLTDSIHLRRITAKITCNFYSGTGVTFDAKRIKIYNYSRSCTLFERSGWAKKDGTVSFQYGTFPGTLSKKVATTGTVLADATNSDYGYEPTAATDASGNTYYTFTFYMPENIPTPNATALTNWTYADREKRATDRTFTYAPSDAAYIVVTGEYEGPNVLVSEDDSHTVEDDDDESNKITGDVAYTIHLGNFSTTGENTLGDYSNFTIRRNSKYVYNVTVNGVDNIVVEAAFDIENQPGAEGNLITTAEGVTNVTLDSHYEQVLMSIPSTASFDDYAFLINTPYTNNLYVNSTTSQETLENADLYWLKFGKPASTSALQEYKDVIVVDEDNGKYGLGDIFDMLADFKNSTGKYYVSDDEGNRYVAVYVDEYYYDADDIHGDIDDVSLSKFINADNRSLLLATSVSISSDKQSIFTQDPIFTINQRSIKTPYVLSVANPFGVESLEETSASDTYGKDTGTSTANGWNNFTSGICDEDDTTLWSTYVNDAANCHVINASVTDAALTTLGLEGAYQCLSRNRDLDGDGYIDADEIKWYLPAMEQTNVFWYGSRFFANEEYPVHTRYWNSYRTRYVWWALEGTTYSTGMPSDSTAQVRCIRALKNVTAETTRVWSSSVTDDGNVVISIDGLNPMASTTDTHVGEYLPHEVGDQDSDVLPQAFMVANDFLTAAMDPIYEDTFESRVIEDHALEGATYVQTYDFEVGTDKVMAQVDLTDEETASLADVFSIGQNISAYYGYNAHFYYTPNSQLLLDITSSSSSSSRSQYSITIPSDYLLNIVYDGSTIEVEGTSYDLGFPESDEIQIGSAEGANRSTSTIDYVDFYSLTITGYSDVSLFTQSQITTESLCANYYSEEDDRSDLGQWRIPNEKEFSLIYQVYLEEISEDGSSTLMQATSDPLTGHGARTQFVRNESDGYSDTGTSFFYMNYNNNLTTAISEAPSNFYVRCVRDYE